MHPNYAGALLNSALFLMGVFVAGLVTAHPLAWKLALAAMAVTFLSHLVQLGEMNIQVLRLAAIALIVLSWLLAVAGAIALLF
jgi:hypothetical protein